MPPVSPLRIALAAVLALWTCRPIPSQNDASAVPVSVVPDAAVPAPATPPQGTVLRREFGGGDGEPGFRVWFDRVGASVRRIELLDHTGTHLRTGADIDYPLVIEELADPSDPARGIDVWMLLVETGAQRAFAERLDAVTWDVVADEPTGVRFRYAPETADFAIEKAFLYDGERRRDLRIELVLRSREGVQHARGGEELSFQLDGFALFTPKSEALYGNAAMAVGRAFAADGEATVEVQRAPTGPYEPDKVPVLAAQQPGGRIDFAGTTSRFFCALLYPVDSPAERALRRADLRTGPRVPQNDMDAFTVPIARYALALEAPAPGAELRFDYRVFLGPKDYTIFDEQPDYARFDVVVDEALDPACFCSVPGARTLGAALMGLLQFLHRLLGNWGLAIMGLTVLVRGLLFPLNFRMQKSMRAYGQRMSVLKPKLEKLQAQYKSNPQELQRQMLAFQREHKLFPPLGGCLPVFLTMPVYLGLFSAIRVSYDLRQQPFFGWISDLSRPDAVLTTGLTSPAMLAHINLLPFVYIGLMLYLTTRQPLPTDPQQRQVAQMTRYLPVVFGVLLYGYAAGMFVYMITSASIALVEQRIVKKVLGPITPEAAAMGTPVL
ncbi:MAG: membrane protein insertase YidC [Planctomycetes bacterium]|nr:membrane protein insertase YidC [Planctomycetota bacterium]